jgi:hypothetical protein
MKKNCDRCHVRVASATVEHIFVAFSCGVINALE